MTGGGLLGLILLSMGWLFFIGGAALNELARRKKQRALGFLPAVVGSVTVLFSIPVAVGYGIDVPWPWLWILLPLALLVRQRV
jgi:predicted MFS family arabinose efflux permease